MFDKKMFDKKIEAVDSNKYRYIEKLYKMSDPEDKFDISINAEKNEITLQELVKIKYEWYIEWWIDYDNTEKRKEAFDTTRKMFKQHIYGDLRDALYELRKAIIENNDDEAKNIIREIINKLDE